MGQARAYVAAIASVIRDRPKALGALGQYMRTADAKTLESAYDSYAKGLDRVPLPSNRTIQNTLDITYRIAPKLAAVEINRQFYFGACSA